MRSERLLGHSTPRSESRIGGFLAHLAPIANIPVRDLTAEDLDAFNQMVV